MSTRDSKVLSIVLFLVAGCSSEQASAGPASDYRTWQTCGGGKDGIRYSALIEISRENVQQLEVAWVHDSGDAFPGSEMQCNPIVVDGVLYATTPKLRVIALDAATGELRWSFDPFAGEPVTGKLRNRGVAFWQRDGDSRIFVTAKHSLYALDARDGQPIPEFGDAGRVDLRAGLDRDPEGLAVSATSPGTVYEDLLILGSSTSERQGHRI